MHSIPCWEFNNYCNIEDLEEDFRLSILNIWKCWHKLTYGLAQEQTVVLWSWG